MSRNNNNSANRLLRSIDQEYIDSLGGLALSPEELCHYFDLDLEFVKDVEMALLKTGNYQKVGVVDPDGTEITERLQMTSLYVNTIKSDLILATLPKIEAQTIVALMKMINQNISPDDVIFQQGKHVIRLTLSSLELSEIPEDIGCFANLKLLDLSNNNLSKLPESVSNLSALETLDLSGNRIRTLPKSLNRLTNLKNINLSGNQLTVLPESIGDLRNLEDLRLSANDLSHLPSTIGELANLKSLLIAGNRLQTLSPTIGSLTNLMTLHLASNELVALPREIGSLSNLRVLNILNNQIIILPDTFDNLSELLECKMDWWLEYDITGKERKFLMQCPNLKGSNRIEVENSHIVGLNFDSLCLTKLPESIRNLIFLQRLNLARNLFLQFPEVLASLPNLKELDYSHNVTTIHYKALSSLTSLTKLIFTYNRSIPSNIGNLLNLKDLDLSYNALTEVPPQIMNLYQLRSLNLRNNKLKDSQAIIDLKRLDRLDLSGNKHLQLDM